MGYKFNPFTGTLDNTGSSSSGSVSIQQYDSDPGSPAAEDAWVLRTPGIPGNPAGSPIGILMALTSPGSASGADTYQFSYYTIEGTIKRTALN